LGKHRIYIKGDKIPHNDFLDYREYDTYADMVAASAGWGANEIGRISLVLAAGAYYYWNGAVNVVWPSTGGAGAPTTSSYVTLNDEDPPLSSSVQHKNLTDGGVPGSVLHIPQVHKASHQFGGADKISVAGLSGLLADGQNAISIRNKAVDLPGVGDDLKFLQYDDGASKFKLTAAPGGGDMLKADYALDAVRVKLAVDSDTLDTHHATYFATAAHANTHVVGGSDAFLTTDLLNSGANVGSRRRINVIEGTAVQLTVTDDAASEEIDIRIDAVGTGLGGTWSTGICSGRSPIVTPHSLGGVPTLVLPSINAVQTYSVTWNADNTNITFYHDSAGPLTITFAARL
jgi:hypothetical protein